MLHFLSWSSPLLVPTRVFFPIRNRLPFITLMSRKNCSTFQWANEDTPALSFSSKFTLPERERPNLPERVKIPIIDMLGTKNEAQIVEAIARACEEFGFFHIINHGIPNELCKNVLDEISNLFNLPYDEKSKLVSEKHMEDGTIYKYQVRNKENHTRIRMWGETLFHTWCPNPNSHHPFPHNLPLNPPHYRSVVATYAKEMGLLISRLLSLISQGLGLDGYYLENILGCKPTYTAQANYYPPCPQPELALGLPAHTDSKLLTVLLQDEGVVGLHFLKDEKWVAFDPIPGALVVSIADQLQALSNDRYKSIQHRAVTNNKIKRVSFALFVGPSYESIIEPISKLIDENNPALYRPYSFYEYVQKLQNRDDETRSVLHLFKI